MEGATGAGRVRVATWNLQWAKPGSAKASVIDERLRRSGAEVAVLTEARLSTLERWSHVEHAGTALYRGNPADGAKVAVVSTHPMAVVDAVGSPDLPPGNFLAVDVETPVGPLRVIGLVVRWNQIADYLTALPAALEATVVPGRTVVAGDMNLRVPGGRQSRRLETAFEDVGLVLHTGGPHAALADERALIDHIAVSRELGVDDLEVWPRRDPAYQEGTKEVTDHAGAALTIRLRSVSAGHPSDELT